MRNEPGCERFEEAHGKCVLVALSGGGDSVALLRLLHARREALGMRLRAAHFNHMLRGEASDGDEAFCRELCEKLGVELVCGRADIAALARGSGEGIETVARRERYGFLFRTADELPADYIALAHHADDQAETVLMHILRGAGVEGACGMARMRGRLYRPLLEIPKAELLGYLGSIGQDWREDATNAISDTPRNALRNDVFPEIEKLYPAAKAALLRLAGNARIESNLIDRLTDEFMAANVEYGLYGARILCPETADEAILRRCLRRLRGSELDLMHCESLLALAGAKHGKHTLCADLYAERTPQALYILPTKAAVPEEVPFNTDGETLLPGLCRITACPGEGKVDPNDPSFELVDADALEGAVLRTRRAGDRITLNAARGSSLLSDRFTDMKLDRPLREFVPLIARGNEVLWAHGVGLSTALRISDKTKRVLRLNIERL